MDFKLSDELKSIISSCVDFAEKNSQKEISHENVLYHIIKFYVNGSGKECKVLLGILDKLPNDKKVDLESICYKNLIKSKKTYPFDDPSLNLSNVTPSSSILDDIIDRARASKAIKTCNNPEDNITITTDDIFESILFEKDCKAVEDLIPFGIEKSNYLINNFASIAGIKPGTGNIRVFSSGDISNPDINKILEKLGLKEAFEEFSKENPQEDPSERAKREDQNFQKAGMNGAISGKKAAADSKTPNLDQFAIDMIADAKEGKFDPVIGRENEIEQIIEILSCRKKNNAVLLGDPGCGKTAIIESLALKLVNGDVPRDLQGKRLFSLDLNALVAGCIYRGQYEERLQGIIKEVTTEKDIIVYIDEFHNLIGNGGGRDGQGDGAQILKPYLARGEFQCIGSTTTDEYRKFVEKDGALKRRFQAVQVEEPSSEETKEILKGLSGKYSEYHRVKYSPEVIEACVDWAGQYINDRFFPDKAIGVLDMASALSKLSNPIDFSKIDEIDKEISEKTSEKSRIVLEEVDNWSEADKLRKEIYELDKKRDELKRSLASDSSKWPEVTIENVSQVISKLTNVPIDKIKSSDMAKVKAMRDELKKKVIGQDEAVEELTIALQRNILGLRDPKKPIASFLLVGPTGVGKTLISKVIAKEFFGSEKNLETIACSEYTQEWAESKLLGSAPGYVGFEDSEPRLYVLKRKPYTVLLIDEIEKSSSKLYSVWLQALEEGEVTLSSGEKVSLRNCIVIFTGNVGTKSLELKGNGIGFEKLSGDTKKKADIATVMKEVKKEFRPEFLNRLNKIIVFNSLGKDELKEIFTLELAKLQNRLKENNGYNLTVSEGIRDKIISECEPQYGARSLQRLIIENVEQEICKAMLDSDTTGKTNISVELLDEKINVIFS